MRFRNKEVYNGKRIEETALSVWWRAFRYHFAPASFLPAILGGVLAWTLTGLFHPWFFVLTVLGVTLNHIALNLTDDYFDYLAAVDRADSGGKNLYSGGSGVLTSGRLKPAQICLAFTAGYLLTIFIGLYLAAAQTWWILAFGLLGMGSAYFYTAPPIRYGYRGLGELSQLINFSFTIGMGAYFVQTVCFSWEAFFVFLPLGLMMFAMITINEIPDEKDDAAAGKHTLVVLFGVKKAVLLYGLAMALAFLVILLTPLFDLASPWIYLAGLTLPWAGQAFRILSRYGTSPERLAPAHLLTIRIHHTTGILLIIAYLIQGILNRKMLQPACIFLLLLAAFYLPAAFSILFKVKKG